MRGLLLASVAAAFCCASALPASFDAQFKHIVETSSDTELYRFFREMPKGGILHLHSEYAVSSEFWLKIATSEESLGGNEYFTKVRVGSCAEETTKLVLFATIQRATWERLSACERREFTPLKLLVAKEREAWLQALSVDGPAGGRKKFFQGVVPRLNELCQDPNLMLVVIPEIMRIGASEHVTYLEAQFDPTSLHDAAGRPVSPDPFVETLRKDLSRSDVTNLGVTIRFQMAAYRYASDPYREFLNAFSFVDRHRDLWVGVNLLGEEGQPGGELSRFTDALRKMRARYDIPFSLHAGEVDSPGHEVRDALVLGASRIGHAVNLTSDSDTMLLMRHGHIPIETSLESNQILDYTPDLATHPFPLYLRSGIPVCLNTDDPGAWDGSLTDEFFLAEKLYHLSWSEIVEIAENSLRYAFLDTTTRERLTAGLENDLSNFEARMSRDDWNRRLTQPFKWSGFAQRYLRLEPGLPR